MNDEERKRALEAELESHKARFLAASRRGIDMIKKDLSVANWVGTYPVEAAVLAFIGGLWLGTTKALDRNKASSLG